MSIYLGTQMVANTGCSISSPGSGENNNETVLIDDSNVSAVTAYSSKKTEERLEEVENKLQSSADGTAKMWQKTILNAENGTIKYYETDADNAIDKIMIQCYKFVPGETEIVQTLKEFNNIDADNFFFSDQVAFEDSMKIKDKNELVFSLNADGLYESSLFCMNEYIDVIGVEVE